MNISLGDSRLPIWLSMRNGAFLWLDAQERIKDWRVVVIWFTFLHSFCTTSPVSSWTIVDKLVSQLSFRCTTACLAFPKRNAIKVNYSIFKCKKVKPDPGDYYVRPSGAVDALLLLLLLRVFNSPRDFWLRLDREWLQVRVFACHKRTGKWECIMRSFMLQWKLLSILRGLEWAGQSPTESKEPWREYWGKCSAGSVTMRWAGRMQHPQKGRK